MEVVKAAANLGLEGQRKVALAAAQNSYSYGQLLTSAWQISSILKAGHFSSATEGQSTEDGHVEKTKEAISESKNTFDGTSNLDKARIGIIAKPSAEFVAGMWATWINGAVAVPLALSYPQAELLHVMNDAGVSVVMGTEEYRELLKDIAQKCSAEFYILPSVPSLLLTNDRSEIRGAEDDSSGNLYKHILGEVEKLAPVEGDKPALIVYTSGTTGKPKGVVHTHNGLGAQVKMLAEAWGYSPTDQFLHCLPLHHVHGLFNALFAPLYAGAAVDFMPKFSVRGVWQRWRESYPTAASKAENAITVFTGVPTMYVRLLQGYDVMDSDSQKAAASAAHQLRLMMCGSSALPYPVMEQWERITGHRLLERYGMTEFGMALSNPLNGLRKGGTVGKPLPGVQVKILAEDANNSSHSEGELCIKSPSMFKEYWQKPQVTKESFEDEGYFKTGDSVKIDEDGCFVIMGRTSVDILKVGGYKLSALEIEAVLLEHPDISECAVLGLPDKDYGEVICAVTVPDAESKARAAAESKPVISLQELQNWAKEKIAPYKIPEHLHVWDSLPRNAMGKVNKKELKKLLLNV
uniref:TSA: Wollemia nobilis Ref_Wollemi_Transcript_11291_2136 transcribed RNA sequence n=1 Tax=Wollemia nobilis TaxID=56998 RepID=A0A0C9RV82_9CONI